MDSLSPAHLSHLSRDLRQDLPSIPVVYITAGDLYCPQKVRRRHLPRVVDDTCQALVQINVGERHALHLLQAPAHAIGAAWTVHT